MTARGTGSRNSPIIIDDDDDKDQPPRKKVNLGPSTVHTETPPHVQGSVFANIAKARDSILARQEGSEQSRNGIGYSILIRMGYKPGYGLGVNLEGVTSPVKASVKPQKFPVGLGASDARFSRNRPSRNVQRLEEAPAASSGSPISLTSKRVNETSPSLPANATTAPRRRLFTHASNQEPKLNSPAEKVLHSNSVTRPDVGPSSVNGSKSVHDDSILNTNTAKTLLTTHRPDFLQTPHSPQEAAKTCPIASRVPLLPSNAHLPLPPIPPSIPLRLPLPPIGSRVNASANPPLGSADVNTFPNDPLPLLPPPLVSSVPYVAKSRGRHPVLGMFPDDKAGGTRGTFPKDLKPPPDWCRSLVMETLPRKFRTDSFILDWLLQFSFRPSRFELADGKVFFEFENQLEANLAWNSPRMGGKEGLQGVRLFWYRKVPPPALWPLDIAGKNNVTGTIGSSTQPQPYSVSDSPTDSSSDHIESQVAASQSHDPVYITSSSPLLPLPSTANNEIELQDPGVAVASQVEDVTPNTSLTALTSGFSGDRSVPSPTTTTSSLVPTPSSDHPDHQMAVNYVSRRNGPPGGALGFSRGSTLSPTLVHMSPTPAPTFSPKTPNSWPPPTTLDYQAHPQSQSLLQASQSTMQKSHSGTKDRQSGFGMVNGARPLTPDLMDTVEDGALAKEAALRQLVLQSRKRKVAPPPASQQPAPSTTSTATSKNTLEELAVNFIVDAIARPPPAKRMKATPSVSALAEWGKLLDEHIKTSKLIMVQMQLARSQAEKDRLRAFLQEKNRLVDEQKAALFTRPAEDVPVLVSPWPESHPDGGILILSDSDDSDDYDDDDADDIDME